MAKKGKKLTRQQQQEQKKQSLRIMVAVIAAACLFTGGLIAFSLKDQPGNIKASLNNEELTVPLNKLKSEVSYIRYGGTQDIMVYRDAAGSLHTAFDTCEECFIYGARYSVSGSTLTCSYCGNTYGLSYLGLESWGGCQPVAIPEYYRGDTDSNLVIPAAVLDFAEEMFAAWQTSDYSVTMADYLVE